MTLATALPLHSGHGGPVHPDVLGGAFLLLGLGLIAVGAYRLYTYEEPGGVADGG